MLSHVGEEKVPQVDLAPSPKEVEVSESNSKAIEPGVDVVENFVDNTAAVDTRPATFPTEEQVEELLGTATEELIETADSSILDEPKMVEERPSDVGRPYTYDMWKTRRDALFNSKSSERLPFADSHMHLDKLQNASKRQDLCEIMKHGPRPSELVELKFAVANFCHGVPTKQARERAYLLPPEHNRCEYNTPYGIVNVAIRIADLRYQNLKEILDITTTNAMVLYKLK